MRQRTVVYDKFNKFNISPYVCKGIGVFDSNHNLVRKISLDGFRPEFGERRYRFGVLSDVHQRSDSGTEAYEDFQYALKFFEQKESVSFICSCGDITQRGCLTAIDTELGSYDSNVRSFSKTTPIYTTTGNHDVTTSGIEQVTSGVSAVSNWKKYTNCRDVETTAHEIHYAPTVTQVGGTTHEPISFYFTHEITPGGKKDYFLFLSMRKWAFNSDEDNTFYPEDAGGKDMETLGLTSTWIKDILDQAESEGCRAFVTTHMFFPDKAGNFAEAYPSSNWMVGAQYNYLNGIFNSHKNVVWFSGHSHWKWHLQEGDVTQKTNKFLYCNVFHDENQPNSGHAVHIPSCARPIDAYWDGTQWVREDTEVSKQASEGCVIDVYDDYVDVRGVSFKCYWHGGEHDPTHMLHYQPIGTYRIYTNR